MRCQYQCTVLIHVKIYSIERNRNTYPDLCPPIRDEKWKESIRHFKAAPELFTCVRIGKQLYRNRIYNFNLSYRNISVGSKSFLKFHMIGKQNKKHFSF